MIEQTENYKPDTKTRFWNIVQLLAICVVFLAPIAGAFLYKPTQFNNYGDLYTPARELSALRLQGKNGESQFSDYKANDLWAFLVVAQGGCGQACEKSILNSRQLRAMQGKHLERLRSVFIYADMPEAAAQDLAVKYQPLEAYRADGEELAEWAKQLVLENIAADELKDRFYVVDSKGLLMLSYPSDAEPKLVDKDLRRLLKSRR